MAQRITSKNLESVAGFINKAVGASMEYGALGHFFIDSAYEGYALHRLVEGGGERDVLNIGHIPAKALYELCHAYLKGVELGKSL